jgi:ABC-2 type transport system permease protein
MSATPSESAIPTTSGVVDGHFRATRSPFSWLVEREVVRYLKIWHYSLLGPIVAAVLMLVVLGLALDHKVVGAGGVPYDRFIAAGLIAQAVLTTAYYNGSTTLFEGRRDRYINDVLASPLRWWEINLAVVIAGISRAILTFVGMLVVTLLIVGGTIERPLVLILGLAGMTLLAAQFGVLCGIYVRSMDHLSMMQNLVVQPITFLGGTFYTLAQLPHAWRVITQINPMFYIVQSLRIGMLGSGDIPAARALGVVWGVALVLSAWSLLLFRSGRGLKD